MPSRCADSGDALRFRRRSFFVGASEACDFDFIGFSTACSNGVGESGAYVVKQLCCSRHEIWHGVSELVDVIGIAGGDFYDRL